MTEQELIDTMAALTSGAQSVLQAVQNYGTQATGTVTFTVGGSTYTIKTVQQAITDYATQQASDRTALIENFGGLPSVQTVVRDSAGRLTSATTTFANGYQNIETLTRDIVSGITLSISMVIKNELGVTVRTSSRTINRTNGLYSGVS